MQLQLHSAAFFLESMWNTGAEPRKNLLLLFALCFSILDESLDQTLLRLLAPMLVMLVGGQVLRLHPPCRSIPDPWPPDLFDTGRIHFGAFYTPAAWVSGAVIYGYPEGRTHPQAHQKTESILVVIWAK